MNKLYIVYMICGGETGDPYLHAEFVQIIRAKNEDEAFQEWVELNKFNADKFEKQREGVWRDYHSVHCQVIN